MPNIQLFSEFTARSSLANLGSAIDESLVRRIDTISHQLQRIEYLPEQTDRARLLKNEIIILKDQLSDIRGCAKN